MKPLYMQLCVIADQERLAAEGFLGPVLQSRWDSWFEQRQKLHQQIGLAAIALDNELQMLERLGASLARKHDLSGVDRDRIFYFLESGWSEQDVEAEIAKIKNLMQLTR